MKKLFLTLCMLAALVACSGDYETTRRVGPVDPVTTPVERTVIVYISGENTLSAYVNPNLKEMKEGSLKLSDNDCLLVYVDKSKNDELPWLARISKGQITDSVSLSDMGISKKNEYASDPQIMEKVLKYAFNRYPASIDYGLVLWGHSTGWLISNDSVAVTRAYGVDNGINSAVSNDGKWMNVPTLAQVLGKMPRLKFIFADCCMFMCLESLYELRGVADYIIGSPAEVPQDGAPYHTVVPAMFDRDNFYNLIVENYYAQKNGNDKNLDLPLTVVKSSEMDQLATATRTALQAVKAKQTTEYADLKDLIYYNYNSLKFFYNSVNCIFYDAGDFLLAKDSEAYKTWKQAYDKTVIKTTYSAKWYTAFAWDSFYGNSFTVTKERQHGISMYVPQSPTDSPYADYERDIQKLAWYYTVLK